LKGNLIKIIIKLKFVVEYMEQLVSFHSSHTTGMCGTNLYKHCCVYILARRPDAQLEGVYEI